MNELLKAIYAMKCEQIQIAWLNPQTRKFISNGLAFAASRRMYPYFHINEADAGLFDEAYTVSKDFVTRVVEYIDNIYTNNPMPEDLQFYNLERHFGGHHIYRGELITIIRYCYLSDVFNNETYSMIMSNAPVEAHGLTRPLEEQDIAIYR